MALDPIWSQSGLTVVLLPAGERGLSLLELARDWTVLKLLRPSVWVRPEEVTTFAGEPPRVKAHILGSSTTNELEEVEVDLFEQLARQGLTGTRLLVVRPLAESAQFDSEQDHAVEVLAPYLKNSIPQVPTSAVTTTDQIPFLLINLLVGPTEHVTEWAEQVVSPKHPFNAHIVASPEDRSSPFSGDAFVRYDNAGGRFAGFAMMHIATIAGFWQGLPRGGYELIRETAWEGNRAYVSRVFASAILTDGLIQRACARVLERAASADAERTALTVDVNVNDTYAITEDANDQWIDFLIGQAFALRDGTLDYHPAIAVDAPSKTEFTLWRQFADFARFSADKLARVPAVMWLALYRRVARLSNATLQGGDKGAAYVDERLDKPDVRDLELLRRYDQIAEEKGRADRALVSPVLASATRTPPELWSDLRKLVFAFLDGSGQERFGVRRTEAGWPVFPRVQSLFTDPGVTVRVADPDRPGDTIELDWLARDQTTETVQRLAAAVTRGSAELDSLLNELVEAAARRDALRARLDDLDHEREEALERREAERTAEREAEREAARAAAAEKKKSAKTRTKQNPITAEEPDSDHDLEPSDSLIDDAMAELAGKKEVSS
jgi:hypothetical protein